MQRQPLLSLTPSPAATSTPPALVTQRLKLTTARKPVVLHTRVVTGQGGGPDKTVLNSPRYIDPATLGMAAAYICPRNDTGIRSLRSRARRLRCPLWEIPETGPMDPRTLKSMLRLCRELDVSVWHGHDYKSNLLGLLLRPFWPMKLVTTVHGWTDESLRMKLYHRIDGWCLRRFDHVIAVSQALVTQCGKLGVPPERLTYIPNGIDDNEYDRRHNRAEARRALGLPDSDVAIGVVGRLSKEKGVDRAIRMLAGLKGLTTKPVHLHIIGQGPQRGILEALTGELGLRNAVRFWPWQQDMKPLYESMDLLVLPSHTEGLPNVALEAMAMRVPVAATPVGAVPELLDHGACGTLLDDNPNAWPGQIEKLLAAPHHMAHHAAAARHRIEQRYSFDQRMRSVLEVYRQLMPDADIRIAPSREPQRRAA